MADINQNTRVSPGAVERKQIRTNIIDFRNKIGELARPNIFEVEINFPTLIEGASSSTGNQEDAASAAAGASQESNVAATELSTFLVKSANLPSATVGVIEVPFRGRTLKIAGDRTFEPWTVTVLNDEGFRLRRKFEAWSKAIQQLSVNLSDASSIASYQSRAIVRQQNRQGLHTAAYTFEGIWPSNISAIDLAWDSNDTPEEYTVEFQVQYWQHANDTNTANAQ